MYFMNCENFVVDRQSRFLTLILLSSAQTGIARLVSIQIPAALPIVLLLNRIPLISAPYYKNSRILEQ